MDLWSEVGSLWDQAGDGEPERASARATVLIATAVDDSDRAILLSLRALCELVACDYPDATRTSLQAAMLAQDATGPRAETARYYSGAVRLVAAAMLQPERSGVELTLPLPDPSAIHEQASELRAHSPSDCCWPTRLSRPRCRRATSPALRNSSRASGPSMPWTPSTRRSSCHS